jgi:hypothetical protein
MTMRTRTISRWRPLRTALITGGAIAWLGAAGCAQWSRTYEQFYLPGSFNWQFLSNYPAGAKLFNAFDFGHAILYETLWTKPNAPASELEEKWYNRLTQEILVNPPRVPLEEAAIEVAYARLAPEAKQMFDWAHLLHRQIYDVWADERIPVEQKDALVAEIVAYYKTRPDLAFSSRPKTMELMEGQSYSTAFRNGYPKFNGLIWAYHWLQIGLYEPLIAGANKDERQSGVLAAVTRFRQMIEDPPTWMPRVMPMTPAVAPLFTARYPEAAIIFDNLHSMHDVVSDILANPAVPRAQKRAEILLAAERYRDDTSFVMTTDEWLAMSEMMGIQNMGGPVMGFLAEFPTPTVERGAVMAHMDHGAAPGAQPAPGHEGHAPAPTQQPQAGHEGHAPEPAQPAQPPAAADPHAGHAAPGAAPPTPTPGAAVSQMPATMMDPAMQRAMEFILRLLTDPEVEARIHADPRLHQLWSSPAVQRHLQMMREQRGRGGDHQNHPPPGR